MFQRQFCPSPPLVTPLRNLAANAARIVRADQRERMRRLKLVGVATAVVVLVGWAAGVSAQTTDAPTPPPLPPAVQNDAPTEPSATLPPQAAPNPVPSTAAAAGNFPALPLGHEGVREVQSQLIALGFEPGGADGEVGPATLAAARQYNENRGGSGPVPIDGALLTRLQQDTGTRLTPEQVAARTQPRTRSMAPARAPAASNPIVGAMQRFDSSVRGLFNGR
jgi:hypothetical protein